MKRLFFFFLISVCAFTTKAQSDVDTRIAVNEHSDNNTFVLIISNENYKYEQSVPFSLNDGEVFKLYCERTIGIPAKNIKFVPDATFNDMRMQLMWLNDVMDAYQGDARAIVYYSGHGMPSDDGKHAYLLPIDGNSRIADSGYSTEKLFNQLGAMPSKGTIVLLDACFSGARRDGQMLATNRGVAIKVKNIPLSGNLVVFSAAQGDETAFPYQENEHGLFTYFLLSILQEKGGCIPLGELCDHVTKMVSRTSIVENNKRQTPTVNFSPSSSDWRKWMIAAKPAKRYENTSNKFGCPNDRHPHMVDLGLPSGTKWACCNYKANDPSQEGELMDYTYVDGNTALPTKEQANELVRYCTFTNKDNGTYVKGPNNKCIFFPNNRVWIPEWYGGDTGYVLRDAPLCWTSTGEAPWFDVYQPGRLINGSSGNEVKYAARFVSK